MFNTNKKTRALQFVFRALFAHAIEIKNDQIRFACKFQPGLGIMLQGSMALRNPDTLADITPTPHVLQNVLKKGPNVSFLGDPLITAPIEKKERKILQEILEDLGSSQEAIYIATFTLEGEKSHCILAMEDSSNFIKIEFFSPRASDVLESRINDSEIESDFHFNLSQVWDWAEGVLLQKEIEEEELKTVED